jgi:FMN phosphatase YigB (HAD superfamily)
MGLIDRLLGRKPGSPLAYDEAKQLVRHDDPKVREELARRRDVRPELLYFLAEDGAAEVRRAIAGNASTPRQADLLLARDGDPAVRTGVVQKIAMVLPVIA